MGEDVDWNQKVKNKIEALEKKREFERKHGLRQKRHYDFQGGILQYHQWITLFTGASLFTLGIVLQQGAWIYFYLFGLIKILKDTAKDILTDHRPENVNVNPLTYYLIGALLVTVLMLEAGYTVPDMHFGLVSNTAEVLP